jgi:hypothetical protein
MTEPWLLWTRRPIVVIGSEFLFGSVAAYGIGAEVLDSGATSTWPLTMLAPPMHFWYDGFIWSVRKASI